MLLPLPPAPGRWHRCLPPPRAPPDSPPLPAAAAAFVWRVLWARVCMSVCVFGFQANFLEFLPLLCVSPHVTSPAVAEAEAAAAAAAPGIGLEQESRFCSLACALLSALRARRREKPGPGRRRQAGGAEPGEQHGQCPPWCRPSLSPPWGGRGGSPGGTCRATCPRPLRPAAAADSAASLGPHLQAVGGSGRQARRPPFLKGLSPGLCHGIHARGPLP